MPVTAKGNNMSKFLPTPGTLFHAECLLFSSKTIGGGGAEVVVREREMSFSNYVMRCAAVDLYAVVADIEYGGGSGNNRRMLRISDYKFHPVGPGVTAALGLEERCR
jgi:hypothetical protein